MYGLWPVVVHCHEWNILIEIKNKQKTERQPSVGTGQVADNDSCYHLKKLDDRYIVQSPMHQGGMSQQCIIMQFKTSAQQIKVIISIKLNHSTILTMTSFAFVAGLL